MPSAPLCPVGGLSSLLRLRQIRILCCVLLKSHVDFFKFIDLLNFIVKQMFINRNIFNCVLNFERLLLGLLLSLSSLQQDKVTVNS